MSESMTVYMVASRFEEAGDRATTKELQFSCVSLQASKAEVMRVFSEAYDRAVAALPHAPYLPEQIDD